jgi:hypothetical protein
MTKKTAQRKYKLYHALSKMKPNILGDVLEHLSDNSVDDVCECVYNVIKTDLKLPAKTKNKLRRQLRQKCSKKNISIITSKNIPVSKRKRALSQEGTGIGLILGTVVPLLAQLLFNRKK